MDGPWLPNLHEELISMDGFEVRRFFAHKLPIVVLGPCPRFESHLPDAILEVLSQVVEKYGDMSNAAIKMAVYQTEPMRSILREERAGKDMRNKPVLYRDKIFGG